MTAAVNDSSRVLRSFTTQFASVPHPGPVNIEVTVERTGTSMTTTSAHLLQDGRVLQVAHAASSTNRPGTAYDDYVRPRGADPGDVPRFVSPDGVEHFRNADVRLDPNVIPFGISRISEGFESRPQRSTRQVNRRRRAQRSSADPSA